MDDPGDIPGGDRYRQRWTWDRVTWGTHCLNCLATCPYRAYSRDGAVALEEPGGSSTWSRPASPT